MKRRHTTLAGAAKAFRQARFTLLNLKAMHLPFGQPVQVCHERYHGPGTLARVEGDPDKVAVTLENGSTHFYPVECVTWVPPS